MTDEQLKEAIKALQAKLEKKPLQRRINYMLEQEWEDCDPKEKLNFTCYDYRPKPEPRRVWLRVMNGESMVHRVYAAYASEEDVHDAAKFDGCKLRVVEFVEVVK
jgi:predicted DNA binding CopG/RHH family protein